MMPKYALISETGLPLVLAETDGAPPPGSIILAPSLALETLSRQMLVEGAWQDRPAVHLTLTPGSPASVTLVQGPPTCPVRIIDVAAGEVLFEDAAEAGASWSFPEAGRYAVESDPPEPWLPAVLRFEVTP